MRVIQIIKGLNYGDGVSKCLLLLKQVLDNHHIENVILAEHVDNRISKPVKLIESKDDLIFPKEDIVIYHFHNGFDLNYMVENLKNRKILVYQNITPPAFFRGIDNRLMESCLRGYLDAHYTAGKYMRCMTMSDFSKRDLIRMGWEEKDISVIPLLELEEKEYKVAHINFL